MYRFHTMLTLCAIVLLQLPGRVAGGDTWKYTTNMGTPRSSAQAVALADGRVLMIGGWIDGSNRTATCEIYDPATATWTPTGSLAAPRTDYAAALLNNGKVLVSGGMSSGPKLNTAEIYDPVAGTWSNAGTLPFHVIWHQLVVLDDGRALLCSGRSDEEDYSRQAALYDPVANSWSSTGSTYISHTGTGVVKLPNGKVFVAGGETLQDPARTTDICEVYDPAAGTWSQMAPMNTKCVTSCVVMQNGKVLRAGRDTAGGPTYNCEEYDPAGNTWSATANVPVNSARCSLMNLADGRVLLIAANNTTTCLYYDPAGGSWSSAPTLNEPHGAYPGQVVYLNSGFLFVAGNSAAGYSAAAEIFGESDPPAAPTVVLKDRTSGSTTTTNEKLVDISIGNWTTWTKYPGNPVMASTQPYESGDLRAPYVMVDGGVLKLYYECSDGFRAKTALATSADGIGWAKHPSNPVFEGVSGQYDYYNASTGSVVKDGGVYKMWYTASAASGDDRGVAYATSTDGVSWTRVGIVLPNGGAGEWDAATLGWPMVIKDGAGYLMWYCGSNGTVSGIGYATSPDGITWTKYPGNPVLSPAASGWDSVSVGCPSVMKVGRYFRMYYVGSAAGTNALGEAESGDGISWTRSPNNPILSPTPATFDALGFQRGSVILQGGTLRMWYEGCDGGPQDGAIGYATSTDGGVVGWWVGEDQATVPPLNDPGWANTKPTTFNLSAGDGNKTVHVYCRDEAGNTSGGSASITLDTSSLPVITSSLSVSGTYNAAFSYTITATGSPAPSFSASALPPGVSFSSPTISGTPSAAGTYNVMLTATNSNGPDNKTLTITIAKATPTITWNNPAGITYPAALSGTQLNATASVPGSFAYSPAVGAIPNAGTQTLSVTFSPTDTANYTSANASVAINVAKGTPVVTWNNPADITYPAALGGTQLSATANTVGSFAYTPLTGVVLNAGAGQALSVQFTPDDTANWNTPAAVNAVINVLKGTPVITWKTPLDITYPTALGAAQLNATADVPGAFAYTPSAGTVLDAVTGAQLEAQFTPTDTANYNSATLAVKITVLAGVFSLSATPNPAEPGKAVTLAYAGGVGVTVTWDFGDGSGGTGSSSNHVYTAEGFYLVSAKISDGANTSVQQLTVEVKARNNRVIGDFVIAPNPAKAGADVNFTATANANAGVTAFLWKFGDGASAATSTPEVKHAYAGPGEYTAVLTVVNADGVRLGSTSQTAYIKEGDKKNISDEASGGKPAENPLEGLKVTVVNSNAGVVQLKVDVTAPQREAFAVDTDFGVPGRGPVPGSHPVFKYEQSGIYVTTSTATDTATGAMAGLVRKTIAISTDETGEASRVTAPPASKQIAMGAMKGKFIFKDNGQAGAKPDAVTFTSTIELPEGFDIKREHILSIAAGNVTDTVTVTDKGGPASQGWAGRIKKLQIKYPKLPKGTTVLGAGQKATVSVQFSTADMDLKGFDTEGITSTLAAGEAGQKSVQRAIQMAFVLDGVAYETQADVQYKISSGGDAGMLSGRGPR